VEPARFSECLDPVPRGDPFAQETGSAGGVKAVYTLDQERREQPDRIGSLYYLGYASTHVEFIDEGPLWAVVAFTIFASTVIHGLTASATVDMLDRERGDGDGLQS